MTRKPATVTPTPTETPVVVIPETPVTVDVSTLVAQRKALDEQIRAAKLAQPKPSKLVGLIER